MALVVSKNKSFISKLTKKRKLSIPISVILLGIYFFALPLDVFSVLNMGTILKYYAIVVMAGIIFSKHKDNTGKIDYFSIATLAFLFLSLISILYSISFSKSESYFFSLFINFIFVITTYIFVKPKESDYKFLMLMLVLGNLLTVILTFVFADYSTANRLTITIGESSADQNYINGYMYVLFASFSYYTIKSRRIYVKIICIAGQIGLFAFTILTGSRGGLFGAIAIILAALVYYILTKKHKIFYLIVLALSVVVLIFLLDLLLSVLPPEFTERFTAEYIYDTGTTNRFEIWDDLLDRFLNHNSFWGILFGVGTGCTVDYSSFSQVAHNIFIDVLVQNGVIGLFIYIVILAICLIYAYRSRNCILFSAFCGFLVFSMTVSIIVYKPMLNCMIMMLLGFKLYKSKMEEQRKNPLQ